MNREPLSVGEVRERYNSTIDRVYENAYEEARWTGTPLMRAERDMMDSVLTKHVLPYASHLQRYLEAGPGPGTWSRYFIERYPGATFDLVDVSRAMLSMAQEKLPHDKVQFIEADFCGYVPTSSYDFFFSSRALEYFPDKVAFFASVDRALGPGGRGAIVTKMPQYGRRALLRRSSSAFHAGQIGPSYLHKLLRDAGFEHIRFYPAITIVPLLRQPILNRVLYSILSRLPMNPVTAFFCESYLVTFQKAPS